MDWNTKLKHLMGEATQLVRSGHLADATRTLQQALGSAVARDGSPPAHAGATPPGGLEPDVATATAHPTPWRRPGTQADIEDVVVVDHHRPLAPHENAQGTGTQATATHPQAEAPGSFTRIAFTHTGTRHHPHHYHLYVPRAQPSAHPCPLC
ncbi:hypothetical protein [Acidovorax sp. 69]|uniref:hypothetical protein n=1 Tax=Acidovorax sp. 69 TaxID=2035202 RepID=UPI001E299551|nr:hypothetical protein [Acidovorax sp. 69]